MASDTNKKLSIFYVLNVLKEYSDENHLLTLDQIAEKIYSMYGMQCERKSISTNIDSLIDLGYDIVRSRRSGNYLASREFEPSEINYLVDAVFSSKSLDSTHAKEIADKLTAMLSKYNRRNFSYIVNANQITRTDNKQIFYNIDIINEAIENNKKISFTYKRYYVDKSKKANKLYVSPYFFVNNQGKYYLVCSFNSRDDMANYRVDNMHDIQVVDSPRRKITTIPGFEKGVDMSAYANSNIYMLNPTTVRATIKILNDYAENYVVDWFGDKVNFYTKGEETFASFDASEQSLIYWCLQYGDSVELVAPETTRNTIKEIVDRMNKRYGG